MYNIEKMNSLLKTIKTSAAIGLLSLAVAPGCAVDQDLEDEHVQRLASALEGEALGEEQTAWRALPAVDFTSTGGRHVHSVMAAPTGEGVQLIFVADTPDETESWHLSVRSAHGTQSLDATVDGTPSFHWQTSNADGTLSFLIETDTTSAQFTAAELASASQPLAQIAPRVPLVYEVLVEIAPNAESTLGEFGTSMMSSSGRCEKTCRARNPKPDDCEGAVNALVCCIVEASYDNCVRMCRCSQYYSSDFLIGTCVAGSQLIAAAEGALCVPVGALKG